MAKRFKDGKYIDYTPSVDKTSGDVIVLGALVTVADVDLPANVLGAVSTEGSYTFTKATLSDVSFGDKVYFDIADDEINVDSGNPMAGWALEDAGTGVLSVLVKLARV